MTDFQWFSAEPPDKCWDNTYYRNLPSAGLWWGERVIAFLFKALSRHSLLETEENTLLLRIDTQCSGRSLTGIFPEHKPEVLPLT
jgi:hypothetical protein